MTRIVAIDPGSEQSAWLVWNGVVESFGISPNVDVLLALRGEGGPDQIADAVEEWEHNVAATVVIEQIESYGMAVGREVFDTVWWAGRFTEAAHPATVVQWPRRKVKIALCGSNRAKDQNVRLALMDRFGGAAAKGTKKAPGPLYGIANDVWSALAIAVTYAEANP